MRYFGLLLLASACGRTGFEEAGDGFVPAHLPAAPPRGTASLVLGDSTIDTSSLTVDGATPSAIFTTASQPGGPEVAVLAVDMLEVTAGTTVRVVGARPLVIVGTTLQIDGVLDAGARGALPGPGGSGPEAGAGAGASTQKATPDVCDPGAGGGGFAQPGAAGGAESCGGIPGTGGASYGDASLAILVGGSGGGSASPGVCTRTAGGAGGGAIQLTAYDTLAITGGITAGGGGGAGGPYCGTSDGGAGGGGGAGGAIFVEARVLDLRGMLAVNGGGGGAGGNGDSGNGPVAAGEPGTDGTLSSVGIGGIDPVTETSGRGGAGGSPTTAPTPGSDATFNPGGGGGAAGRVVVQPIR